MGSGDGKAQSIGFHPNGLLPNEEASVTRPLDRKQWARAEENAAKLISCIQPNWSSEKRRNAVASHMQRLIANCMPCQVVTFGSVPLKTYLPDGDIDLTAFSEDQNMKDEWADEVRKMLEKEKKNVRAEFKVKEVQLIQAEVKIIKCLVDDIVVDISFNQLGGLCTLCFLEEVDNLINQNHLFKRSIILIKAWCYYESRILGAHHGLISTYALETLVLYIFHVFGNSFAGPLEVLYRFLVFFSRFDWANYCVSLWGPVPISSLPKLAAIPPRMDGGELLLNKLFMSACSTAYSVFPGGLGNQEQPFMSKHFNVIDPLRINNNLGRSVSKGNFYRIRSAFNLGAHKLARILECQEESIAAEVNKIFMNTWKRQREGCRPNAPIINVIRSRQVDSVDGGNLKKHASTKKSTESLLNHVPEVDQSHQFPKPTIHFGNFPLSPTIRNINALNTNDDTTGQDASGWGHNYTWGNQQNGKETCRIGILENRGHPLHQFSRTCSSPDLTNISSEAASCRRIVGTENMEADVSSTSNSTRRTRGSSIMENHVAERSTDEPHIRENTSRHVSYTALNSNCCLGSYVGNYVADFTKPILSSGIELAQNVNLASSSGIQNYDGHVSLAYHHPLVPIPPSVLVYNHHNFSGTVPSNLTSLESNLVPVSQHLNVLRIRPDEAKMIRQFNRRAAFAEVGRQDERYSFWTDYDNTYSIREIDTECEELSTASSRLSPSSPATSYRTKASSESSWDENASNITNSVKSSVGNNTHDSWNPNSYVRSGWHDDGQFADQSCNDVDYNCSNSLQSVSSLHAEVYQLPGFRPPQTSYPNSMLPFAPSLLHPGSQQVLTHNHAVLPVTIYPAAPPLPYIINMVPVYNVYAPVAPTHQLVVRMEKPVLAVDSEISHTENYNSIERSDSKEHSDIILSDIFHGDFDSHWKNLQYGRLCQSPLVQHPCVYPPSVVGAPQHLPERLPFNDLGKPSPVTTDAVSHLEPVPALQPDSGKSIGFSSQYGGEVSRSRNGTGTYFPNPTIFRDGQFSTARQSQEDHYHDRNEHHENKEANWKFNPKTRFPGRVQHQRRYEKPNTRIDYSAHNTSQTGHSDKFRPKYPNHFQYFSKGPSTSKSARKSFINVGHSMYQMQSAHHNEIGSVEQEHFEEFHCRYPTHGNHDQKIYHGGDSG